MNTKPHLFFNIDINTVVTPFLNRVVEREQVTPADLYPFVDQYGGTQITDILFNIFCQYSATDSAIWTTYADKYAQKTENGLPVDYTDRYGAITKLNREYGIDPYAVWIARTKEMGMRPWISVRMNDCHDYNKETSMLHSSFFYEEKAKGHLLSYGNMFDYALPEVRKKMLGYIDEQLNRYDIYGIELDFQREIRCFDLNKTPNRCDIMNGFIREVKRIVDKAAKKWGHKINIAARLSRDLAQSKAFGFDAVTWAREALIDLIVPTPRWATCDDDMPISDWKAALPGVSVIAGLEVLANRRTYDAPITAPLARALSAKYLSQGSDGIYLYNYFLGQNDALDRTFKEVFTTCGSLETALQKPMRYVVMWQDTTPPGFTPYQPLPLTLPADGSEQTLDLDLGILPKAYSCTLTLGIDGGNAEALEVIVNGQSVSLSDAGVAGQYGFCEPGAKLVQGKLPGAEDACFSILMRSSCGNVVKVSYCEILVDPENK